MSTVHLKGRREKSLVHRHPWVYSGAIERVDGAPAPGELVAVVDADGAFRARGYFNDRSKIQVRVLTWNEDERVDDDWWRARIDAAVERRAALANSGDTTAYRLVHAEADGLPGLVVDRYGDVVVVQFLTAGTDRMRAVIVGALMARFPGAAIYDRSDAAARQREGLEPKTGALAGSVPDTVAILENGFTFHVSVATGQKTGFYLDQRYNRRAVAEFAAGARVLDAFCYTGACAVYAARAGAKSVTLVDSSAVALSQAEVNLAANDVDPAAVELVHGDVFEMLRACRDGGHRFDLVILDPPKFATNRHQVDKALRAYKDANRVAMQVLEPGGILATFSCSAGVGMDAFTRAVSWAGIDAGRDVQILRRLGQGIDHPVLASFPESEYLTGLVCRVV